jgi:hypothetical protein
MIDALFGSKTRVKLLHLFLNNPGQPFYVREITRKIGEQINSVRRELANMINVGIITSDSSNNKLYYQINQSYEYFVPLRTIFGGDIVGDNQGTMGADVTLSQKYSRMIQGVSGIRVAILAGTLVKASTATIDIILVGEITPAKAKSIVKSIEKSEGREINYSILSYDEFYYRLSVRDKFITEILNDKHIVIVDKDNVLSKTKGD